MPPLRAWYSSILVAALLLPARSDAQSRQIREVSGSLVAVSVEVAGGPAPLYPAPDGSDRWYLEAREGSAYAVTVANRTSERLGVVVAVDGLNAISVERQRWPSWWQSSDPGRMYVLEPWGVATVQGWRTSLDEVRRFTFVDEEVSYAARSGKSNAKMGWIEIAVFRERDRYALRGPSRPGRVSPEGESGARDERAAPAEAPAPLPEAAPSNQAGRESDPRIRRRGQGPLAILSGYRLGARGSGPGRRGGIRAGTPAGRARHVALRVRACARRPGRLAAAPARWRPAC